VSKATTRNSPRWLDALELPGDEIQVRVYPAPRVRSVEIDTRNAAEVWAATLPDLAIYARRRELHLRTEAPAYTAPEQVVLAVTPLPHHRSALRDAARNAALLLAAVSGLAACMHWL